MRHSRRNAPHIAHLDQRCQSLVILKHDDEPRREGKNLREAQALSEVFSCSLLGHGLI
jgi:hypothetical protein